MIYSLKSFKIGIIILLAISQGACSPHLSEEEGIIPSPKNSYYWQYKGNPLLLMGGTWQDNLFNHPYKLAEHLDLLVSVGGNYVRNTMSHRNIGNEFPFNKGEDVFPKDNKLQLNKPENGHWLALIRKKPL